MHPTLPRMKPIMPGCALVLLVLLTTACSSGPPPQPQNYAEPVYTVERLRSAEAVDAQAIYDPWRGMNKRIYNFNYHFDRWVLLPVVRGWNWLLPQFARTGLNNFFNNFRDVRTMANSALQASPTKLFQSTGRVLVNSTAGLLGFIDVASKLDFPRPQEDFGQTLGRWGVGKGPYLVIPFLGPSNLRDTTGLIADSAIFTAIDPFNFDNHSDDAAIYYLLNAIDTRHRTAFRYYETGSAFEYDLIRMLYGKARQLEISK